MQEPLNLVIVGDREVGKTGMLQSYANYEFLDPDGKIP